MPNRHKPIGKNDETLLSRHEERMARLRKIKDSYNVLSLEGCEIRKPLRDNPGLENELCSHHYVKNSINIRDALYGGRTETTKTWYKTKRENKSTMLMWSVCTHSYANMESFL